MAKTSKKNCTHPRFAVFLNRDTGHWCSLCGKEGLAPPGEAVVLPAGIYKLSAPIENKYGKDGRSKDWDKAAVIEPGDTYFVTTTSAGYSHIKRAYNNGYVRVDHRDAIYDELVAKLVPVTDVSDKVWMAFKYEVHGYDAEAGAVLLRLMKNGSVTREQIEACIHLNSQEQ